LNCICAPFHTKKNRSMIQPPEAKRDFPVRLSNGALSTTSKVWSILTASRNGDLQKVKDLVDECAELAYAQYNYAPPIHFAVREGQSVLVDFLLNLGAYDSSYRIYPFGDSLETIAGDRGLEAIVEKLKDYEANTSLQKYKGDNGEIIYNRSEIEIEFERVVDKGNLRRTKEILDMHPGFATDETFFWSEGILLFAAKEANFKMIDLLMSYGAKVPNILKWTQAYYFERYDGAAYMMKKGMNPNVMSWQHVTILHDMAQKGDIPKAELLLKYGAEKNVIEEEYQSTPLGLAARWGQTEMVNYLLRQGADIHQSGATWATPLAWAKVKGYAEIEKNLRDAGAVR
jgi:uncharacterized protein